MSFNGDLKGPDWKETMRGRLVEMVEDARKEGIILISYDGPLAVCPNCGRRISNKWTHISDPSGVGCHGFLTKEVHGFQASHVS